MTSSTAARRRVTLAILFVIAASTLTACAAPQVRAEAKALTAELDALEHVSSTGFAYQDLGGWEADEITFRIDVSADADADAVAEVAAAAYTTIRDDDDVSQAAVSATLHLGDDHLTLRIYESSTPATQVATVVRAVVPELDRGRTTLGVDTSMRKIVEPVDLSVNQVPARPLTRARTRRSEARWQRVIDAVGRGVVHVGR